MTKEQQVRRIVMRRMKHFKGYVAFSFFMAIAIQLIALIPPLVMQQMIDVFIPEKDWNNIMIEILVCIVVPLLSTLLSTYYNYRLNAAGRNMGAELTLLAGEKLVYQPISYFQDKNSAELATYCSSESMKYIVFWLFDMPELAASLCAGGVIFFYIINQSVSASVVLLFYIPVMLIPSNYFATKAQQFIEQVVKNKGKAAQILTDTFRGIKLVKASVLEEYRLKKVQEVNQDTVSVWAKVVALDNLSGMWTNSVADRLFTGIVFGIVALSIINGNATVGILLVLLNYLPLLFDVVRKAAGTNFKFKEQLAEYDKLFELIVMEDERNTEEQEPFVMQKGIVAENLSFQYDENLPMILNNTSFYINNGEWVGIVGESGAGKSTLFQLLLRFYDIVSGSIKIDNTSINKISKQELRKNIAFVSQDTFLFPGTLRENLQMVNPDAGEEELKEVLCQVGLDELLTRENGLDSLLGENGLMLSGGQRQRLGLAQGLLRNSQVLLLDEVTANVDNKSEETIRELVYQLQKEKGLTVISVSHRKNFLSQADRIYEINQGKLSLCDKV